MKYLLLASLVLLSACSRQTEESNRFVLPPELKHCTMYYMVDNLTIVYVVHCPNATTTTYKAGKYPETVTVISE